MDSGHSNEARWPNNTLLTYTLPRTVKVRESVDVSPNEMNQSRNIHNRESREVLKVIYRSIKTVSYHELAILDRAALNLKEFRA